MNKKRKMTKTKESSIVFAGCLETLFQNFSASANAAQRGDKVGELLAKFR